MLSARPMGKGERRGQCSCVDGRPAQRTPHLALLAELLRCSEAEALRRAVRALVLEELRKRHVYFTR